MTQRIRRRSSGLPWAWFAAAAAGGIPVGLLWWLLSPGGLNLITRDPDLASGTNPEVWLPRDLTLAGLFVFAGCLLAVFITDKSRRPRQEDLALALAGSLAGAFVAWQTGMFAAQLWGAPADTSVNASVAFSLRSLPVLLLWPAAAAIGTFAISLLALLKHGPEGTAAPGAGEAAPGA
ncbi:MAG TPA: hypothetical protein VJ617_13010 [Arthrobacter sp.]|nr:hypothetical protein [Arthrobacter sp.]